MTRVRVVAPGPAGHGVVRHALTVARLAAAHGVRITDGGRADLSHAQFTDGLWGPDIARAAEAFADAAQQLARPLVVTLHDLPGADPDPARDARRSAGYRRVAGVADRVVVSSRHEADKAAAFGAEAEVIPLPLPAVAAAGPAPRWAARPTIGVLGFVYPGKGHAEAVDAAARLPERPRVVAAGAVSPGHDALWTDLSRRASRRDVELTLTGSLDDAALAAAAAAVTVPLAANRLVSASGSLLAWIAHGRVPLAADGPYAREVAASAPVWLYGAGPGDGAGLDAALRAAFADPARTRRDTSVTWPDAGAGHADLYSRMLAA